MNHAPILTIVKSTTERPWNEGARAQILGISWHLMFILSLPQFPKGWGKQERRGSGKKESRHQLGTGFFRVGHACNTLQRVQRTIWSLIATWIKQPTGRFFFRCPNSSNLTVVQALTFLLYAVLVATDLWLFWKWSVSGLMWEDTGNRRNVYGIIVTSGPWEGMFALYGAFILWHRTHFRLFKQGQVMGFEPLLTKPGTGFGSSQRKKRLG